MSKHATVEREGFRVPLIGIPETSVLQECDCCHQEFPIRELEVTDNGGQVLCGKCRTEPGARHA